MTRRSRRSSRWLPALVAFLAGLLLVPHAALAQAQGDEGTFDLFLQGRKVGTEEFTIRETGAGTNTEIVAVGRVQLALPSGTVELTPRLRATGYRADPIAYEVDVKGDAPRTIVGKIGSGRFSARITSPSGEQLREYVASSGATVLEDVVAHHYYFLARRARSGRVPVLIPRENRQVMATVVDRGEERLSVNGTPITVYHLVVQPENGDERHVWVDDLNRVIRVEIPSEGYEAIRTRVPR